MWILVILLALIAALLIWNTYRITKLEKIIADYFEVDDGLFIGICEELNNLKKKDEFSGGKPF